MFLFCQTLPVLYIKITSTSIKKNLCIDRKRINLQKAWEKPACLFSQRTLKVLYELFVHLFWWQIRNCWTTPHRYKDTSTASGLQWNTGQSQNLAAWRAGVDCCVCLRLLANWIVSPVQLSHTHLADRRWLVVTGFEKQHWFQLGNTEERWPLMDN